MGLTTPSERVAIKREIEGEIGKRRGRDNPQNVAGLHGRETRDIASERAGFGNAETARQAEIVVHKAAPELVQAAREDEQRRRDAEIAAKAAEGKSNRQIAREIGVDERTVRRVGAAQTHSAETPHTVDGQAVAELYREQHEDRLERARLMVSPGADRWHTALQALRGIAALPAPDEMMAELHPTIDHAVAPVLHAARDWINAVHERFFR